MQTSKQINIGTQAQVDIPSYSKTVSTSDTLNFLLPPSHIQGCRSFRTDECIDRQAFDCIGSAPNSLGVASLLATFRATGGVVRGNELAMMLEDLKMGDLSSLGKDMASGEICSFQWRSASWIPMFQFDLDNLEIKCGPRKILRELSGVFDEWMLTAWFARPNSWLSGRKPVDLLAANLPLVHEAARADRFVAVG